MAKIKLTKNELKQQRDALKRFLRYLPTLQLKKQQLQIEIRQVRDAAARLDADERGLRERLARWVAVLDESASPLLEALRQVREWRVATRSVAGIELPVFDGLTFAAAVPDLFRTPPWVDDAAQVLRQHLEIRLRQRLAEEQLELIVQELRVVTQRVNLFEKVKIPEARENIRRIQIYLGDQQTNAVGRAKIAKEKCQSRAAGGAGVAA
jgi:V/A-type H+/Na+-transporting ATPase subunit D